MTEYTLPFTCKARDRALWIYALIVSPMMGFYGLFTMNANDPTALSVFFLIGGFSVFVASIFIKLIQLDMRGRLPTFRCKCDKE